MRVEGYEPVKGWRVSAYWYEKGKNQEEFWADFQNLIYHKLIEELVDENDNDIPDKRIWWLISPYKPIGEKPTEENVKWLVELCNPKDENNEYIMHEWNFNTHSIKK